MNLEQVRQILARAQTTKAAGGKRAADRIIEHGELRAALDWLVGRHVENGAMQARLVTRCTAVLQSTRLMPGAFGSDPVYSIANRRKFDQSIRELREFLTQLAAEAAKETKP